MAALISGKGLGAAVVKKHEIGLADGMFELFNQPNHFLRVRPTLFAIVHDANRTARLFVIQRYERRDGFCVHSARPPHHRIAEHPYRESLVIALRVQSSTDTVLIDRKQFSTVRSPAPKHVLVISDL